MNRDACTVFLVRGTGPSLEVYLVERGPELRFFGGYLALPGGVRESRDVAAAGGDVGDASLLECGARELFEETGVLLGDAPADAAARDHQRRAALAGDDRAWSALAPAGRAAAALQPVCRIRTPPFAPVRYDTLFALARLPRDQQPEVWPGELVGGRFWRPAEALRAWRDGEVLIVPPVLILLELMVETELADFRRAAADTAARYHAGELHRVRFTPGIVMASVTTPTLPPATTTNCLVVGERQLWLVDPGCPEPDEQHRLFALIDSMLAEGRSLAGIALTHHHPDHAGAVAATAQRYGVPVRGHPLTLTALAPMVPPGPPIADGDRLPLGPAPDGSGGWHLQAIHTPGHARGHLCYRESRYGALVAGDMVSTVSTIVIDPPEGHMATYLGSLERLLATPMSTLYPAHGPAARDGHRVIRGLLAHRAARQQKLEAALGRGPATAEQLLAAVYDDVDPRLLGAASRSLLAGLQWLAERGLADERDGVWHPTAAGG